MGKTKMKNRHFVECFTEISIQDFVNGNQSRFIYFSTRKRFFCREKAIFFREKAIFFSQATWLSEIIRLDEKKIAWLLMPSPLY